MHPKRYRVELELDSEQELLDWLEATRRCDLPIPRITRHLQACQSARDAVCDGGSPSMLCSEP